jgi:cobalt-zinc-cadmium efflux system membrane fusion protein
MKRIRPLGFGPGVILLASVVALAGCTREGESDVDDHAHDQDEHASEFTVAEFERFGVGVAEAAAGTVDLGVDLPAEVRPDGERVAHVSAPYPGVAREVRKSIGDAVRAGDVLAVIESDTLARYPLEAALDGVVIDRDVVAGEAVTRERTAFVIADLRRVWVEISVYPQATALVHVGREVVLRTAGGAESRGEVSYLAPVVDPVTRTVSARIVMPNPDGRWRPGLFVTAVVTDELPAAVVVPAAALQSFEGRDVLFVVEDDHFVARPVVVGRRGRTRIEIAAGLSPSERYATREAFRVKAELGKGAVLHAH